MSFIEIILDLLVIYAALTLVVYFVMSNSMMFKPQKPSYKDTDQIIKLTTPDGKKISAVYLENKDAKYTILYSHGNASDLGYIYETLERYVAKGFSVFAYDYHGYGTSEGRPSEQNVFMDVQTAYNYLVKEKSIDPKTIIALGRSIGSGPTTYIASKNEIGGIILESPFYTAFRVKTYFPIFFVDKFRNNKHIKDINVPVLILHGDEDETISLWHSEKLYDDANDPKKLVVVSNGMHNDLHEVMNEDYWEEVELFVHRIEKHNDQ